MDSSCFRKRASHLTCHEVKSWKQGRFVSPSRFLHSSRHVLHAASRGGRGRERTQPKSFSRRLLSDVI